MRTIVLGIGNTLMSDEAIGVRVVEVLEERGLPDHIRVVDGGTCGMELLDELADADLLVVVDAVLAGKRPGELVRLAGAEVPVFFRSKLSPHQVGLSDVLASLEFAGQPPKEIVVIGVQPESFALSLEMTPAVAVRVSEMADQVVAELAGRGLFAPCLAEAA